VVGVLAREVGELLRAKGLSISAAESCTGGKVGDLITDISGSSDYFLGGIVSYGNRAKAELLGVKKNTLAAKGAVSPEVAKQMAIGVRRSLHTDIGVGITGIAGPLGGTLRKPVGLVYIAVDSPRGSICSKCMFKGTRTQVKKRSADRALELVIELIKKRY